ncbi:MULTISPECIES: hypothetical protein [Nostocales]|uniref:Uncharacterized protein n=3 Tax=Nostocales TaxID=1161 RepID=A0A8S9TDL6_9CYAN|nr:hypothetical protein DA73_0400038025 [Tolypothrix bouteillei VB521301]
MPQLQALAPNEQILAQRELNQYIEAQANAIAPETPENSFGNLALASQNILTHAMMLAQQKDHLSKSEYKKRLLQHGWKNEDRKYLKVAIAFGHFASQDLAKIEPATLFRLANNPKKYQSVIDQLRSLTEINQSAVRDLIAQQQQPREPKQEQASIWRRTKNGGRYCQIPPIHEEGEQTGTTLQKMMDEEGLTAQRIVAEAIALRQAYKEGRLVLVESSSSPSEEEVWVRDSNADTDTERTEETTEGEWTFEPAPEKDDCMEDDDAVVKSKPEHYTQSPVELLIETFQNATTWEEIRMAVAVREDCKQEAWQVLTPVEKKRVRALMPIEVKKLKEAKKAGLIVDFQELREGVYQVRRIGNVLGEVVSASRLDTFLAQLRGGGQSFA